MPAFVGGSNPPGKYKLPLAWAYRPTDTFICTYDYLFSRRGADIYISTPTETKFINYIKLVELIE